MLGVKSSRVCIPNNYGDGAHELYVCDQHEKDTKNYHFKGTVEGSRINVYNYDCLHGDELSDPANVLCKLHGCYGIYAYNGTIILERWR